MSYVQWGPCGSWQVGLCGPSPVPSLRPLSTSYGLTFQHQRCVPHVTGGAFIRGVCAPAARVWMAR